MKMLYCNECGNNEHFTKSKVIQEWDAKIGRWLKLRKLEIETTCSVCGSSNVNSCTTKTKGLEVISYCV